jgi:predicted nucleic acid-binding Zn ribbon protein
MVSMMNSRPTDDDYLQQDYQRRRVPVRPAKKIGDVVAQLLAKRGYARVQAAARFDEAWRNAAGERYAGQTRCGNVHRGVLEVFAANSAVVQELTFAKAGLLRKLSELAADQKIKDLKFRVGSL